MSTIASPRVSSSIRSPSSTRTSFDVSGSTRAPVASRRNRAALRDYYGLKGVPSASDAKSIVETDNQSVQNEVLEEEESLTELDKEGFNAEAFVNNILATSGLEGVLKVEADLVSRTHSQHLKPIIQSYFYSRNPQSRQRPQIPRLR